MKTTLYFDLDCTLTTLSSETFWDSTLWWKISENIMQRLVELWEKDPEWWIKNIRETTWEWFSEAFKNDFGIWSEEYFERTRNNDPLQYSVATQWVTELLQSLYKKWFTLYVFSDAPRVRVEKSVESWWWSQYFTGIITGDSWKTKMNWLLYEDLPTYKWFIIWDQEKSDIIPAKDRWLSTIYYNPRKEISSYADYSISILQEVECIFLNNLWKKQTIKQIGVMWSAADLWYEWAAEQLAYQVGKLLWEQWFTIVYGAEKDGDSLSSIAARGAKESWALTVGVTYGKTPDIWEWMKAYTDVTVCSWMNRWWWREYTLVSSCDAIVTIGWWSGTLNEVTVAYQKKIPIVSLQWTWWRSDKIAGTYLDWNTNHRKSWMLYKSFWRSSMEWMMEINENMKIISIIYHRFWWWYRRTILR